MRENNPKVHFSIVASRQSGHGDPRLAPLANNGGQTLTHALLPDSPARNTGTNTLIPDRVRGDQRGSSFSRIISEQVDIGAFEALPVVSLVPIVINSEEGTGGTTSYLYNLVLSARTGIPVTVTMEITGGTATIDDFAAVPFLQVVWVAAHGSKSIANDTLTGGGGRDRFIYSLGDGTNTITDFGSIGKSPNSFTLAEADVIQFQGAGLTARNLLLTQVGANLELTFDSTDTKIILQNVQLENLENRSNSGNILFDGQVSFQNSGSAATLAAKIVYNRGTGDLLYNENGATSGLGGGGRFATLTTSLALSTTNFLIRP
ncbi:hypothetical protein C7B65_25815 [Phormidesmis priestleyi ULC007]|uniref:Calcium-binding protein n=2 Tax=Phormidesmis priestleyi TaxID=268141 RepID=A0A2T1D2X7_9CYAN|nr:choice-of-anchor Q domain-containing protein [Phormidesmis priestleyi]PSB14830.1 hypothetical protein C7B65_25815 [Phormidesmis priestleyi ULC007]PZO45765.1 MAG: hypothetical protein DCF14_24625 [Phormidesmis priestleyi]